MSFLKLMIGLLAVGSGMLFFPSGAPAQPQSPTPQDKCPVCGMFVAKYPDFIAQIDFQDGHRFFFDGAKDMFKFYFNLKKYAPARKTEDIRAIFVTEYYDMKPIDALKALFVIGSDVYGPMGRELIPFDDPADAENFRKDHKGQRPIAFERITPALVGSLE